MSDTTELPSHNVSMQRLHVFRLRWPERFFFFFHAHISLSYTACRELKQIRNQTLPYYLVYTMFKWQRYLLLAFTLCLFWCLTCSANPSPSSLLTPLNDDSNGVQFMEDVLDMTENQDYCNVSLNDCYFCKIHMFM